MRTTWALVAVAVTTLTVAGAALGATVNSEAQSVSADTSEVTCSQGETACEAPSASAELSVDAPDVRAEEPKPSCVAQLADSGTHSEECSPSEPETGTTSVGAHVAVDGLVAEDDGSDGQIEAQSAEADAGDGGMFGAESEGALILGALGLGASGAAAWLGLKRVATFLLAPLASRLKRGELLENDKRRAIYEQIQEDPGVNLRGLADDLDLAWGTLLHHLRKLEDNHLITSERYGKYRRFFLNGSTYSQDEQDRLAALSTPSTARVAEYILENPGANQTEVGDAIGVTPSTILFHVRRLKDVGLVEEKREGRYVHYYPNIEDHEAQQMATA